MHHELHLVQTYIRVYTNEFNQKEHQKCLQLALIYYQDLLSRVIASNTNLYNSYQSTENEKLPRNKLIPV